MRRTEEAVLIRFDGLTRCYGETVAVRELNLAVNAGEVYGLLGPNGAGKTTALKVAVGLLRPTAGTVEICGYDIRTHPRQAKARLGFVPDSPLLVDKLSAVEQLELVATLWGVPRKLGERRADELLALFGLTDVAHDRIETYSRGMRKRLALAAALMYDPQVLILDEPTEDLDPPTARLVRELLGELARRGRAVLIATHLLAVAEKFCDRVGILHQGQLYCRREARAPACRARRANAGGPVRPCGGKRGTGSTAGLPRCAGALRGVLRRSRTGCAGMGATHK